MVQRRNNVQATQNISAHIDGTEQVINNRFDLIYSFDTFSVTKWWYPII